MRVAWSRPAAVLVTIACGCARGMAAPPADAFERYLRADFPVADGFDFPVGDADGRGPYVDAASGRSDDGWYVATRFGGFYGGHWIEVNYPGAADAAWGAACRGAAS